MDRWNSAGNSRQRSISTPAMEAVRTTSHTRVRTPMKGDSSAPPPASIIDPYLESGPPTLPPVPFEREADVSGHEWWLEAHLTLAANVLCVEQLIEIAAGGADALAIERSMALLARLDEVRDALYELYCDTADPRMASQTAAGGVLPGYIARLYSWCDSVADRLVSITTRMKVAEAAWSQLAPSLTEAESLLDDVTTRAVRTSIESVGVDFTSPVEPLRTLPKDLDAMFASAAALCAEIERCVPLA
jgi:hypothetical protein